jgi:uncharacterized membrane protein
MFKKIASYFFQGLLYVSPIGATVYVLYKTFDVIDSLFELPYPGVGFAIIIIGITGIGVLGNYLIQLPLFNYFDKKLTKAPLVKLIYTSVKDLMKAFVGKKRSFNKPVLLKVYDNSDIRRLGFITDDSISMLGNDSNLITVYLPHSFAISGQLFLAPPKNIEVLEHNSADVMKYIVAGGVSSSNEEK